MRFKEEKVPPFRPLSKRSKYLKPNEQGQVAANCVELCHSGRNGNCQLFEDWQDVNHPCKVVMGEYCKDYECCLSSQKGKQ